MSFNPLEQINNLRMNGDISETEFNYLRIRIGIIEEKFDDIVAEKRDDFESLDFDKQLEDLQTLENLSENESFLVDCQEVEENEVDYELTTSVTCNICNEEFKEIVYGFSLKYGNNDIESALDSFNNLGRVLGSSYEKRFTCFDCLSKKLEPVINKFLDEGKNVIFQEVIKPYLDECFSIQEKNEKERIEEERKSLITIDRKNFIKQVRSNLVLNFS